jgi:hypothetical protein
MQIISTKKAIERVDCLSLLHFRALISPLFFFLEKMVCVAAAATPYRLMFCRKEMSTPAATAEPITPDTLEDMQ